MKLNNEREPQGTTNGSNEESTILSEGALRQLSKSLMVIIPNDVDSLEEDVFGFGFRRQAKDQLLKHHKAHSVHATRRLKDR